METVMAMVLHTDMLAMHMGMATPMDMAMHMGMATLTDTIMHMHPCKYMDITTMDMAMFRVIKVCAMHVDVNTFRC